MAPLKNWDNKTWLSSQRYILSFNRFILKQIKLDRNSRILDIGCGPAQILEQIPRCDYYGYDIDQRSIQYAKKKYRQKNYHFYCKKFNIKF